MPIPQRNTRTADPSRYVNIRRTAFHKAVRFCFLDRVRSRGYYVQHIGSLFLKYENRDRVQADLNTLGKYVKILTLFSKCEAVMSVPEIAERLQFPPSSTYRYISALKQSGLIEQGIGGYHLGAKILELAHSIPRKTLHEISLPIMGQLSAKTGETIILSGLCKRGGICLEKVEGHHTLRVSPERGASFPLHAGASGKVLLAFLDRQIQEEIINQTELPRFSETTITDPKRLRGELRTIKREGVAFSDGEAILGTYGIAAPIFSSPGKIVAALSVSAPSHRLEGKKRGEMAGMIVAAAKKITDEYSKYDL